MATKKKTSKKRKKAIVVDGDPPVIVGGGGSSYIWVNLNQGQRPVNPQSNNPNTGIKPGAPTPTTRADYSCSRITRTPPTIIFFDGETETELEVTNSQTWYIRID